VHGLFALAFANRQTFPDNEISALTPIVVQRTNSCSISAAFCCSHRRRSTTSFGQSAKIKTLPMAYRGGLGHSKFGHAASMPQQRLQHEKGRPACAKAPVSSRDDI
jgi:hypothetical protein